MDQLFLDRLAVDRLDDLGRLLLARRDDPLEDVLGLFVAGEDALQIQHGEAAQAPHLDRQPGPDHPVHRRGDDRQLEALATQLPGDVDLVRVDGQTAPGTSAMSSKP